MTPSPTPTHPAQSTGARPAAPVSQQGVFSRIGRVGILAIIASSLPALGSIVLFATMKPSGEWLRSHGFAGLALYVIAFAILAGLALLPTYTQSILGGFAFGIAWGLPGALLGFAGGAVIGYEIARLAGAAKVEKIVEEKPKWRAVRDALLGAPGEPRRFWKTLGTVTLLRLNSPFALTNIVMASVSVPRFPYVLGTLIGLSPRTTLSVIIGAGINELTKESVAKPKWLVISGIAVAIVVAVVIGMISNAAVKRFTESESRK